ncbi:membrane transporter [Oryctes borbonicus]|uniref:Lysosomal dipeptide transporter MFSD1 n=1 Tax=Oryctes borbonicus TaxID=1629725 RepID=A0A0T6BEL9_9SCAR|nr:membrane transporter [Oryctes borbonicus]
MEGGPNIQETYYYPPSDAPQTYSSKLAYHFCDPRGKCHRFIALLFMCFLGFGSYFCYDNPGALVHNFKNDLNLSESDFMLLYSLYSWPNVILCFIGGFLIDRVFGIRLGTNIYMFITLVGHLIFAYGTYYNTFYVMAIGRFIFGIGGESVAVAQNNYAVLWFKGKELNMVFGIQLSLVRVGSAVNFWVMEPIYDWVQQFYLGYQCLGVVLFIAGLTCLLSMICSLMMGILDARAEKLLRRNINAPGEVARLSDVKDFPAILWLISIICVAYYATIFPFIAEGKDFLEQRFGLTPQQASMANSMIYIVSAVASPFFGILIDKVGKNLTWVIVSILITAVAHSLLVFTYLNPFIGTVQLKFRLIKGILYNDHFFQITMGLGYSLLASALWPLVALITPEYQMGTAYGICQAIQNLGNAVMSILTGVVVGKYGYFWLEIFFLGWLTGELLSTSETNKTISKLFRFLKILNYIR